MKIFPTAITYGPEVLDTHNAMDPASGYFTVPIAGTYGFFFTADIYKRNMNDANNIVARVNDQPVKNLNFQYELAAASETTYFALNLNIGDRVNMYQGEGEGIEVFFNPITFMGFLMHEF